MPINFWILNVSIYQYRLYAYGTKESQPKFEREQLCQFCPSKYLFIESQWVLRNNGQQRHRFSKEKYNGKCIWAFERYYFSVWRSLLSLFFHGKINRLRKNFWIWQIYNNNKKALRFVQPESFSDLICIKFLCWSATRKYRNLFPFNIYTITKYSIFI